MKLFRVEGTSSIQCRGQLAAGRTPGASRAVGVTLQTVKRQAYIACGSLRR